MSPRQGPTLPGFLAPESKVTNRHSRTTTLTNMHQQYRHASQQAYYRSLIIVPLPLGVGFTFVPVPVKAGVLAVSSPVLPKPVPALGVVPLPQEVVVPVPLVVVIPGGV